MEEEDHGDQTLPFPVVETSSGDQSPQVHGGQNPYHQGGVRSLKGSRRVEDHGEEEGRMDHCKAQVLEVQSLGGVARHLCTGRGPCHDALGVAGSHQDEVGACLGPSWVETSWSLILVSLYDEGRLMAVMVHLPLLSCSCLDLIQGDMKQIN